MNDKYTQLDCNIICPDYLKFFFLENQTFKHAHFFSKKIVLDSVFPSYEDEDVLEYAHTKNITYAIANKFFSNVRLLKDKPSNVSTTNTIEKLYATRKEIDDLHLLHYPDSISKYALTSRPILIIGYTLHDTDLTAALNSLGIDCQSCLHDISEYLENGKKSYEGKIVRYAESWIEALFGFSWLCERISKEISTSNDIDYSKFTIACPKDYFNLVQNTADLFNIPVSIPIDTAKNLPEAYDLLKDVSNGADLESIISKVDQFKSQSLKNLCVKALSVIYTLQEEKGILLNTSLFAEYLSSKLNKQFDYNRWSEGIKVTNDLTGIQPVEHLLVLGFSDALISSGKDNGLIQDNYKNDFTYETLTTEKNKSKEKSIRDYLTVCDDVCLTKAKSDNFREYPPAFFVKRCGWLEEVEENSKEYNSYGAISEFENENKEKLHSRADLDFYSSIFHDRYDKIRVQNNFAKAIESYENGRYAIAYDCYDNDFDSDMETQEFFREMFSGTIYLSHSSLDQYQSNPFSYFCSRVLKLSSSDHFVNILGKLVHAHAEERDTFNLEKTIDNLLNDSKNPMPEELEGMNRNQQIYFLRNADKVFEQEVLPTLKDVEDYLGLKQVKPLKGDEFRGSIQMPNDSVFTCYFDQVYTRNDKDYVIVDYKTSKNPKNYVNREHSLVGRVLQLPLYNVFFNEVMKQNMQLEMPLAGSYICAIPYSEPYKMMEKNKFVGYTLSFESLYSHDDAKEKFDLGKSKLINDLATVKEFKSGSDKEKTREYIDLEKIAAIQNQITRGKSFGPSIDSLYPNKNPDTNNLNVYQVNERIKASALNAYFNCINYLRNGRLPVDDSHKQKIRWFPVYPIAIYKNGVVKTCDDDYPDISFTQKYQRHLISITGFDPSNTKMHDDFDDMEIPDKDYNLYEENEDDDTAQDGQAE